MIAYVGATLHYIFPLEFIVTQANSIDRFTTIGSLRGKGWFSFGWNEKQYTYYHNPDNVNLIPFGSYE